MIEKTVYDYLCANGIFAVLEEPEKPPKEYVIIEKTGGTERNYISNATLAIQSYSGTLYDAAELNCHIKSLMQSLITLPEICRCICNSDYNFTDSETKRYRYQAVFDITYYEE